MQARRDQVEAQRYLSSRLSSALLAADPDAVEAPTRRDVRALVGGAALASVLVVAVGVYAMFFTGGSTAWRQPGALVVNKDDGGRYVLLDGRLHPVRNMASAKLMLGADVETAAVSTETLADTPRGPALGISAAPEALPAASSTGYWRLCATTPADPLAGAGTVRDVVEVGTSAAGTDTGALWVRSDGRSYLVVDATLHEMAGDWVADVLGFGRLEAVEVTDTWLSVLPTGPALTTPDVPGAGSPGPVLDDQPTVVGQLFDGPTSDALNGHFQLRQDGLLALTPLEFQLAAAQQGGPRAVLSDFTVANTPRAADPADSGGLPDTAPQVAQPAAGELPCAQVRPGDTRGTPTLVLAPPAEDASPVRRGSGDPVTAVLAEPDRVTLAATTTPNQDELGDVHVVGDDGRAFPVADGDSLSALGYSTDHVVVVAPEWLELLPAGPLLDRDTASAAPGAVAGG